MANIITSKVHARGLRKPSTSARIDPQHWASQGLRAYWLMNEMSGPTARDLVRGSHATRQAGSNVWGNNSYGTGIQLSTSSPEHFSAGDVPSLDFTSGFTLHAVWTVAATPVGDGSLLSKIRDGSGFPGYMIYVNPQTNKTADFFINGTNRANSTTVLTDGTTYTIDAVWTGLLAEIYINGKLDVSSFYNTAPNSSGHPFFIGGYSIGARCLAGIIHTASVHSRALNASEIAREYREPYAKFWLPGARRIFLPVEAGGPTYGELSGAASISLTASGTLTAQGSLAGAATLSITPTATLTAQGALSGASSVSLTASGTLTGQGALAGAGSVALTATGTLTAHGALSGATTITLTPSGTLTAAGALAGAATLTLTASGTLSTADSMSGAASLALTPSGTLTGLGALAGAATLGFVPSGLLTGVGALAGAATITLTASGNLTGETAGAISGTATLTLTASGTLTAYGRLVGAATLTLTASGAIGDGSAVEVSDSVNIWAVTPRPTRWAASRRETVWRADPR